MGRYPNPKPPRLSWRWDKRKEDCLWDRKKASRQVVLSVCPPSQWTPAWGEEVSRHQREEKCIRGEGKGKRSQDGLRARGVLGTSR